MNPKHVDWYETTALLIAPSFIHKTKKKWSAKLVPCLFLHTQRRQAIEVELDWSEPASPHLWTSHVRLVLTQAKSWACSGSLGASA
jgi:hypothetical protein